MMSSCNLRSLKRPDSERALEAARERLAKVFGIKVNTEVGGVGVEMLPHVTLTGVTPCTYCPSSPLF